MKPENILLDQDGNVKLIDFGFAKQIQNDQRTKTICGTPEYLAPEILMNGNNGYGKSIDVWAFGVLIFEMIAGQPPFQADNPYQICKMILNSQYFVPSFFTKTTITFINEILNIDPQKRFEGMGFQAVKKHEFFLNVNFDYVILKKINPPWIPKLSNPSETKYFEHYEEEKENRVTQTNFGDKFKGFQIILKLNNYPNIPLLVCLKQFLKY